MRIVEKQLKYDYIKNCAEKYIKNEKLKNINYDISVDGTEFYLLEQKWFIFLCFALFFLIFPLIIFFIKRNGYKNYLNDQINISIDLEEYNSIMKNNKFHIKNYSIIPGKNIKLKNIRDASVLGFPSGSIIDYEIWSNYYKYEIYINYTGFTQNVKIGYHYYTNVTVQRDGKTVVERVRHDKTWEQGFTEIDLDYIKNSNYFLKFNRTFRRNLELESSIFNKENKLKTNDQILTRKIFTPSCQVFFIDNPKPKISFDIQKNTLNLFLFTGNFYLTNKHVFSIKDFKLGEEHMKNIIFNKFANSLIDNNKNISKILALPIWNTQQFI